MKKYPASFDLLTKCITVSFIIMTIICLFMKLYLVIIILIVTSVIAFLMSPDYYELSPTTLIIKKIFGEKIIRINSIKEIISVESQDLRFSIRLFGSGGFMGYFGKYSNFKFGMMNWYATQRKNYLLITTMDNQRIVITPDSPQMLQDDIKNRQNSL